MLALVRLSSLLALFLVACASVDPGGAPGPPAEPPAFRVGDRWVYEGQDGFRAPVRWQETHEVVAVGPQGTTVRIVASGDGIDVQRTEQWIAPGLVERGAVYGFETKRFDPPLSRYSYPLVPGMQWSQRVRDANAARGPYGPIDRYTTVGGYERITTPAGTFDTIRLRVLMRLDDETFWRTPTDCNYFVWYAPALGIAVREERDAEYREKSDPAVPMAMVRVQHATLTLVSMTRR